MYKINQEQFAKLPDELKALYVKLPNPSSEEVKECFPNVKGCKGTGLTQTKARSWKNKSIAGINRTGYEDDGSASRFFKSIKQDLHCSLCYDTIDTYQLTKNICNNTNVNNVEKSSETTQATTESTALKNATGKVNENLVQNVKSAGNLCDLCGTSIAQRLVAIMQDQSQESTLGELSMPEHKRQILEKCLVSFVELRGNTDTIPTMENLNLLFGYVLNAIEEYTQKCEDTKSEDKNQWKSLIYKSKASKSERNKGLDSIVLVNILKVWNENNTTKEEKLIRLMVTGISPQKVIAESGVQLKNANEWNTCLFGKHLMEKYQEDIKSITKTETNSITTSQISNWLTHLLTNEYTADVKSEMENGGNHAVNVENSNTLTTTINEAMALALGVKDVVSGTQLKISVKEGSNIHSTVKPIALMEYLIKMVTPKNGIVLDPFAGSGSTLVAAKQNGYQYIGIELTEEYIPIIEARLK